MVVLRDNEERSEQGRLFIAEVDIIEKMEKLLLYKIKIVPLSLKLFIQRICGCFVHYLFRTWSTDDTEHLSLVCNWCYNILVVHA